jgi:hypothetical protein
MLANVSDGLYSVYAGLKNSFTDSQSFVLTRGIPLIAGSAGALYLSNPAGWSEYLAGSAAAFAVAGTIQLLQERKISLGDKLDEDLLKIIAALASITLAAAWNVDYLNVDCYTALIKGSSVLLGSGAVLASLSKIANEVNLAHKSLKRGYKVNHFSKTGSIVADKTKGLLGKLDVRPTVLKLLNKGFATGSKVGPAGAVGVVAGLAALCIWPKEVVAVSVLAYGANKYRKVAAGTAVLCAAFQYPNAVLPFAFPAAIAYGISKRRS